MVVLVRFFSLVYTLVYYVHLGLDPLLIEILHLQVMVVLQRDNQCIESFDVQLETNGPVLLECQREESIILSHLQQYPIRQIDMQANASPRQHLRKSFRQLISGIQQEAKAKKILKKFPLVLDKATKKVISSLFTTNEIIGMGIMVPEVLEFARQPLQQSVIYFVEPSEESVSLIIKDFSTKHQYQYYCVNIVFSGQLSQKLMELISKQEHLVKRIVTFQQFHLNLVFFNENTCSLQMPAPLDLALTQDKAEKMSKNLFILVNTFQSNAFQIHHQNNPLCQAICNMLVELLKTGQSKPQSSVQVVTIVISDRLADPVSPLVRSLIYNPMMRDIKEVELNYIIVKNQKGKSLFYLDGSDPVLGRYKNKHFSEVSIELPKEIKQFRQNSETAKFQAGNSVELKSISEVTQYNKKTVLYNFHVKVVEELIDTYKQKNLLKINQLQNIIVSGLNSEGDQQSEKSTFVMCFNILDQIKDVDSRMRVMLLMLMCMELPKDRAVIVKEISDYYKKDLNHALGVICPNILKLKEKKVKSNNYLSRHTPRIAQVCINIQNKKQNPGFKTVKISNPIDKGGPGSKISQNSKKQLGKTVVFMAGPMGWNQVSCVQRQNFKSEYYFLGSRMCTPGQYVSQILKSCEK